MEASKEKVILYASPEVSHLNSMVELGKLLVSQSPSLSVAILYPTFPFDSSSTSSFISSVSSTCPSISFNSLPPIPLLRGDPSSYSNTHEMIFENLRQNNPGVREFLTSSLSLPSAFILDGFCCPALEVSHSLQIPSYFFFTSGASALAFVLNFPLFDKQLATDSFRDLGTTAFQIPGLFAIPANHMVESMLDRGPTYDVFVKNGATLPKSHGIIVNTFESLEPRAVKSLNEGTCVPGTPVPPFTQLGP